MRWQQHGDPLVVLSNYGKTPLERFLLKIDKVAPLPDFAPHLGPCWLWTADVDINGYGIIKVDGKNRRAHRWSYEHFVGPIPEGLQPDHLCRVRRCARPDHLEPVTSAENQRRGAWGILKTACVNGHPYTPETTKTNSQGRRFCTVCAEEAQARYRAKKRSERMASHGVA